MKILVGDNSFHTLECSVSCGRRIGQHAGGIKDVQSLVLHGPHIEVVDGNNHENVQIVFAAIHVLIPTHCILQRLHRMVTLVQILFFNKDPQVYRAAGAGSERIIN